MHTIERKRTSFRLRPELLNKLREEATQENISLNTYVEDLLMQSVANKPNRDTLNALREARSGKELETLDLSNFHDYVASL